MSAHFRWYGSDSEITVPFNARYSYPSQANKAVKSTPRIPPKNASDYTQGQFFRIELPAQGYLNASNSFLSFDVTLDYTPGAGVEDASMTRFQNNIQSIFRRVRLMYGSSPIEDIDMYNLLVRSLTEWTSTCQNGSADHFSICEGIGKVNAGYTGIMNKDAQTPTYMYHSDVNTRQSMIHGISTTRGQSEASNAVAVPLLSSGGWGCVPIWDSASAGNNNQLIQGEARSATRRYTVQLNLGLFLQGKLIPLKYMASQLAIEVYLAQGAECIFHQPSQNVVFTDANTVNTITTATQIPTYTVKNVVFTPEILEFDSSYDATFLQGLQNGGVPIKFATWNTFPAASAGGAAQTITVPERSRSVKAVFTVQRETQSDITHDSHATVATSSAIDGACIQDYQYRIGGRYFPASPVQCTTVFGGSLNNGGSEAFAELSKALNIVGDYRLSTSVNSLNWCIGPARRRSIYDGETNYFILPNFDTKYAHVGWTSKGSPIVIESESTKTFISCASGTPGDFYFNRVHAGTYTSSCFCAAVDLETSNGLEISGLNAEEQSDISLTLRWSSPQNQAWSFVTFTYYDAMIVLHENNVLELIK